MDVLRQDLLGALRQITARPGVALVAILTLALGIGANTVAFTAANALFIKGAAGTDRPDTAWIMTSGPGEATGALSVAEFERFADATRDVLVTAVEGRTSLAWQRPEATDAIWGLLVSAQYFAALETRPLLGRLQGPEEADATPTAVVSERFWRDRLDAASLGGLTLVLNGVDVAIVGVLDDRFQGPGGLYTPDVWLPFEARHLLGLPAALEDPTERWLTMVARLAPGHHAADARGRLEAAAQAMAEAWPGTHAARGVRFVLMQDGHPEVRGLRRVGWIAMGAVGLVLLLACFNVANLLLTRAVEREREMAIRSAIGAGRARLVRQLATEGLVLATLAGAVALVVAAWSDRLLSAFALPAPIPQRLDLTLDTTVLGFVAATVLVTGVLPTLAPAVHALRVSLATPLTAQGVSVWSPRTSGARAAMVVIQVAGSTVFLTTAALFVQTVWSASGADLGFERERLVVVELPAPVEGPGGGTEGARRFVDRLAAQVATLPGVSGAAVADRVPFYVGRPRLTSYSSTDARCVDECPSVATYAVGPDFFRTMGIPLVEGTEFDRTTSADGVMVSESFARARWPGESAVGRRLPLGDEGGTGTVVGVARDTRHRRLDPDERGAALYVPLAEGDWRKPITLVVGTDGPAALLVQPIVAEARAVDPGVALLSVKTIRERLRMPLWQWHATSGFFTACGALALALATIGLFGVVACSVSRRVREFGVRMALGATRRRLFAGVLADGARVVAPGLALGILGAAVLTRGIEATFVGTRAAGATTFMAVAALQAVVVLAACLVPARRAAGVDPLVAMRAE